jgi:hypothetical protein
MLRISDSDDSTVSSCHGLASSPAGAGGAGGGQLPGRAARWSTLEGTCDVSSFEAILKTSLPDSPWQSFVHAKLCACESCTKEKPCENAAILGDRMWKDNTCHEMFWGELVQGFTWPRIFKHVWCSKCHSNRECPLWFILIEAWVTCPHRCRGNKPINLYLYPVVCWCRFLDPKLLRNCFLLLLFTGVSLSHARSSTVSGFHSSFNQCLTYMTSRARVSAIATSL